ncbi:MAG: hypothetical protein LC687_03170 [Actinobacteria bacterium]|nr:hypothetical protein [Actinomycetota bacterium]
MDKRPCTDERHEGPKYLPVSKFHKKGVRMGRQFYDQRCKVCKNRFLREQYKNNERSGGWPPEKKRAYSRARSRALTRLAKLTPELYGRVLDEELSQEPEFSQEKHGI